MFNDTRNIRTIILGLILLSVLLFAAPAIVRAEASGNCGDNGNNVTYVLADNGVLTISGTGRMKDGGVYLYTNQIKEVVIENGVTYVGKKAFYTCYELKKVKLPASVKVIGEDAFNQCHNLEQVNLPNGLERIEDFAFEGTKLRSLDIPASLSYIGNYAIAKSNLTAIKVSGENNTFDSRNNCNAIIKTASNKLVIGCSATWIPSSVTEIADSAFSGVSGLTNITIPSSVKYIGIGAFKNTGLTSVTIPGSIRKIRGDTFCNCSSLGSVTVSEGVTHFDEYAFDTCKNLKSISLPKSLSEINVNAFLRCNSLNDVYYAGTKTQWEKIVVWEENTVHPLESYRKTIALLKQDGDITSLSPLFKATMHYQAANTNADTRAGKSSVKKGSVLKNGSAYYETLSGLKTVAFKSPVNKTAKTVSVPATVKISGKTYKVVSIAPNAFKGMKKLTTVTIGKNVKSIGAKAFYGCKKLKKITIKSTKFTKKTIGSKAFTGINKKAVIKCPKGKKAVYKKILQKKGMKKTMKFK